jgi:hypothetical protein
MEATLVEIVLPGQIAPGERGRCFEDPLREFMTSSGIGSVGGAGSTLGLDAGDRQFVQYCSIWIDLFDLSRSLELVREQLRKLGAPDGSYFEYPAAGRLQTVMVWSEATLPETI